MAGVATHVSFAIRKLRVDVCHHADHRPGDVLFGILIAGEIALLVAVGAHHTQSRTERDHGGLQPFSREDFEVLGIRKRAGSLFLSFLSGEGQRKH